MRIEKVTIKSYQLPLKKIWQDRHFSMRNRQGWIITLNSQGLSGQGDCAPLPSAGTESWQQAKDWLTQHSSSLITKTVDEITQQLPRYPPAIACGIDTALIDLLSQAANSSISQWLNPAAEKYVKTNANWGALTDITTISGHMIAPVIKMKIGLSDIQQDIQRLHHICAQLPDKCQLRLDANQAWSYPDAMLFIDRCKNLPIESIEEPLQNPDIKQLQALQASSLFPIALDESIGQFEFSHLINSKAVKRLTLKPMVVGGLRKTLNLANDAESAGIQSVITTTVDSAIGVRAAVHVTAALGKASRKISHGLATSQWLQQDIAQAPVITNNRIVLEKP